MFLNQQLLIQYAVRIISRLPKDVSWQFTITDEDSADESEESTHPSIIVITEGPSIEDLKALFSCRNWEESDIEGVRQAVGLVNGIEVTLAESD